MPFSLKTSGRRSNKMPFMPDLRGCIGFIYRSHDDARRDVDFLAVGFFLGIESRKCPGVMYPRFVTNEHVIREFAKVCVRINRKGGGFATITIPSSWFVTDATYDIAISSFPADTDFAS